jgi:hypothetical protein
MRDPAMYAVVRCFADESEMGCCREEAEAVPSGIRGW